MAGETHWQVGYVFPRGGYQDLRAHGLEALRQAIARRAPFLADRVDDLRSWQQTSLLQIDIGRVRRWFRPGLLLIGDAAHVMSPVGGVGINYAIQDAIVAANLLGPELRQGRLRTHQLEAVQRRREWPTRMMQALQRKLRPRVKRAGEVLPKPPLAARLLWLPGLNQVPARLMLSAGCGLPGCPRPLRRRGGCLPRPQAQLRGASRELYARGDAEFVEHPLHMVGGGLLGDDQRLGDLPIPKTLGEQFGDFALPGGQLVGRGSGRRGRCFDFSRHDLVDRVRAPTCPRLAERRLAKLGARRRQAALPLGLDRRRNHVAGHLAQRVSAPEQLRCPACSALGRGDAGQSIQPAGDAAGVL
jgi:hypothetical protein